MKKAIAIAATASAIAAAAGVFAACGGSDDNACTPDFNAIEQQRVKLCQGRSCGDVTFVDAVCGETYKKSCGACKGGESCTSQGVCAACTTNSQCEEANNPGYFCNDSLQCQKYPDYCDSLADCDAAAGEKCEGNRCVANSCGGVAGGCDAENDEQCIKGKCIPVITLDACSANGSTTGHASSVQFFSYLSGPETVYAYAPSFTGSAFLTVTPLGTNASYDPAIYVLTSLTPAVIAIAGDQGQVVADEADKNKSEVAMFDVEAGKTYYIVVTSDPSKHDGAYKQGAFSVCIEDTHGCKETCATK